MKRLMKMSIIEIYLDWVNNFISTQVFAEYYQITDEQAYCLINRVTQIVNQDQIIH
jgi:hypothetical protein